MITSTPNFSEFNPDIIPYQRRVIHLIKNEFDYGQGVLEVLLSGAVGSAKSILMAHLVIFHCLENSHARFLLGRKSFPDLKETIFKKVIEHLEGVMIEGKDYWINYTSCKITFKNGSEIISKSWADKKYKKFRSYELSGALIEELTENDDEDKQAYEELKFRIGRLTHIKEKILICATNPGPPSHWAYKYFIESNIATRKVFYSVTTDNPFLPESYVRQLKEDTDPKLAQRMIYGKWIEINAEVVYYAYDRDFNFIKADYLPDLRHPIYISWDFNIGLGKPLSAVLFQYVDKKFHLFDEVVVQGMRTEESCDEMAHRNLLECSTKYYLTGDAAGRHRDTRNNRSDYDIIQKFFANYRRMKDMKPIEFEMKAPISNPPIRTRHNMVNSHCLNEYGERRLFVYQKAKTCDEGLRLTQLKKGGNYIEDDSKHFQHITTAIGYGIKTAVDLTNMSKQGTIRL